MTPCDLDDIDCFEGFFHGYDLDDIDCFEVFFIPGSCERRKRNFKNTKKDQYVVISNGSFFSTFS